MRAKGLVRLLTATQIFLLVGSLFLPALASAATIQTDLFIYQDGDTVTVSGVEFGPSEVVDFVTTDPLGAVVDSGSSTSDDTGNVTYAFTLHVTVGGLYTATGTGETSGYSASVQFDPPKFALNATVTPATRTVTQGSLTIGGTLTLGSGACTGPSETVSGKTISLQVNGGPSTTNPTDGAGNYSFSYTPTAKGVIQFKVSISATAGCGGDSQTINYTVDGRLTAISVSCTPAAVPLGSPSTCTASVTDTDSGATATPTGTVTWVGPNPQSQFGSPTCTLGVGGTCQVTYTPSGGTTARSISATYAGDSTHAGSASSAFGLTIGASTVATSVGSITASASTFGGTTNLSATVSPAGAPGSLNLFVNGSSTPIAATYTAGTGAATVTNYSHGLNASGTAYSVRAVFTSANTAAFTSSEATNPSALTIGQAGSTTVVSCAAGPFTYTGSAQTPCSVAVTGVGLSLAPAPSYSDNTNAGQATASYTYAGDTNHSGSSDSKNFTIGQADALCSIAGYGGTYDAHAHGATGSCMGVGGDTLAVGSSLNLGGSFKDYPGGTAHWTFSGGTNYKDQSGDVAITIAKADASCPIAGYSGIYDADAHGASGSCVGVDADGVAAGSSLDLGSTFTDVPGGTAHWTFRGGTNYHDQSVDAAIDIAPHALDLYAVTGTKVYDGGTSSSGVPTPSGLQGLTDSVTGLSQSYTSKNVLGTGGSTLNVNTGYVVVDDNSGLNYAPVTLHSIAGTITQATLTVTADAKVKTLNAPNPALTFTYGPFMTGDNAGNSVATAPTCSTTAGQFSPIASYPITCSGGTSQNYAFNFSVGYLVIQFSTTCGFQVTQPVNADGSSVFKKGSTVPVKFQVCDANGVSIGGTNPVVQIDPLDGHRDPVRLASKAGSKAVDELIYSNTPDTDFRWDPQAQQWIFNLSTDQLSAGTHYFFAVELVSNQWIYFDFGTK
jgi:hypothetical protein